MARYTCKECKHSEWDSNKRQYWCGLHDCWVEAGERCDDNE